MATYLDPLLPISPLSRSLEVVGLPWSSSDGHESDSSSNATSSSQSRLPARLYTSHAPGAPGLHGPRTSRRSLHTSKQTRQPCGTSLTTRISCPALRPLPSPPPCPPPAVRPPTYRPLPQPPSRPTLPTPAPARQTDGSLEHELHKSQKHLLRLGIPESPGPGMIIISPLSDDLESPSSEDTPCTEVLCASDASRWGTPHRLPEVPSSKKPIRPRIDTNLNAGGPSSMNAATEKRANLLSPIEKYYDTESIVFGEMNGNRSQSRRPVNESVIIDVPLREASDASNTQQKGQSRAAADLSKKLKRYSCKWIREKKGKRWVEEDYGQVLQNLRNLK